MEQPEGLSMVSKKIALKAEDAVLLIEVPCWKDIEAFGSSQEEVQVAGVLPWMVIGEEARSKWRNRNSSQ